MTAKQKYASVGAGIIILIGILYFGFSDSSQNEMNEKGQREAKESKSMWDGFSLDKDESEPETLSNGDTRLDSKYTLKHTISEYRRLAQYPDYSDPIPVVNGVPNDSIKNETTIYPAKVANPNMPSGPFMIHYLDKNNYQPGETVAIHAYIADGAGNKIAAGSKLSATLSESGGIKGKVLGTQTMKDNGGKFDTDGDLIYTATFSTSGFKDVPHNYMIILKYDEPKKELITTNSFNFGTLGSGTPFGFSDKSSGIDLVISQTVKIEKAGNYHFQGSLYTSSGNPIGRAQTRQTLPTGVHTIELKWYGKLLCDVGENGPYKLRYFLISNVTEMPGPRGQRLENVYETGPYNVKDFTCDPFNDPFYSEKADALEKELEKQN
jgi:hypothetical protein